MKSYPICWACAAAILSYQLACSITPSGTFLPSDAHGECPQSTLVLTAHPDDEVMFFAPTILSLVASGCEISALCLSNGSRFITTLRSSQIVFLSVLKINFCVPVVYHCLQATPKAWGNSAPRNLSTVTRAWGYHPRLSTF